MAKGYWIGRVDVSDPEQYKLYVAANAAIRDSGDMHHTYIENFKPSKDDVLTLVLTTGS